MPDFACIGAQKAGSSWVHAQLDGLPDVCFPHGKEVHFWDWVEAGKRPLTLDWYRTELRAPRGSLAGDMTPGYATLSDDSVRLFADEYPELRIFMMLRNPIERAWSSARMALVKSELTLEEVDAHWFRLHFRSSGSVARSDYETTLRRYRRHFAPEQVQHFHYSDISIRPGELIDRIYRFIGGRGQAPSGTVRRTLHERYLQGINAPLTGDLWETLRDQYQPLILSLAEYLGEPLEDWLLPPSHLRDA